MSQHHNGVSCISFPHEGGCTGCREAKVCNWCGMALEPGTVCTNGRCSQCHKDVCTPGGGSEPGHGYGRTQ